MDLLGGRMGQSFDADKGILERRVQEGALDLAAGAVARLEIELAPGGPSSAALRGRLVRDGRGWPGMEVELRAGRLEVVRRTDERGAFDFGRVSAGEVRLKVEDVARGRTVLRGDLELAEGEERVLELSFDPLTLDLCLTGAPGPVADAELVLSPRSALYSSEPIAARTGGAGCCRVTLPGCGSYSWSAEAGGAKASGEVHVLSGDPLVLAFRPRVSLAGTLVLAPELLAAPQFSLLSVRSLAEDGRTEFSTLDPSRSEAEFRLELDGAGRYELQAMCGERRSRPIVIDVPAAGLTDQRLSFEIDLTVDRAR
jgi:hypothetical protein